MLSSQSPVARVEDKAPTPFRFSERDRKYIRSNFTRLEELSSLIGISPAEILDLSARRLFPHPTYVFEDGTRWYPRNYVLLMERARNSHKTFADEFRDRIRSALLRMREKRLSDFSIIAGKEGSHDGMLETVVDKIWNDFQSGEYGACLKSPTCGTIIKKGLLVHEITAMMLAPKPEDQRWRRSLRQRVDDLDRLEMPFADYDRIRFGRPLSRDQLITDVRRKYPDIFEE